MENFKKIYMRPNLSNNGQIPANPPFSCSPDIWVAGDQPIADYQKSLITTESYQKEGTSNVVVNKNNFIYIRGKNGANDPASCNVTLYYADGAVIQWPSKWVNNIIPTDMGCNQANINNIAPGKIGVVDTPFVWKRVPPYQGSCHYCLIAQFNDKDNSNPAPKVNCSIDMAKLVQNNLQWGWRNIATMEKKEDIVWGFETMLDVPANIKDASRTYLLILNPENVPTGCEISFVCSKADADGRPIKMERTPVTGGLFIGCKCVLNPGFSGMVSIYLHNPKHLSLPLDMKLDFESDYYSTVSELEEHDAMFLHKPEYTRMLLDRFDMGENTESAALIRLGSYSGVIR